MAEFTKVSGKEICDIKVYALSTCIWCKKCRTFFDNNDIAYSYCYIDLLDQSEQDEIEEMLGEHTTIISYPIVFAEGHDVIVGYNEKKLKKIIEAKEDE
jgi:arsenate reductase-like glutaredoxin family protein